MCLCATLGIKERFFACGRQEFASHPLGVPLTEFYSSVLAKYFASLFECVNNLPYRKARLI
jgi:hypothetical protein